MAREWEFIFGGGNPDCVKANRRGLFNYRRGVNREILEKADGEIKDNCPEAQSGRGLFALPTSVIFD